MDEVEPFVAPGSWSPQKVAVVRRKFDAYLNHVLIDSKEEGGSYRLADGVYVGQKRFLDFVFKGLTEDIHDFKVLKSRQLGMSTMSRALVIFWLGIHPGMRGAMIFDTDSNKEEAREEIGEMIKNLPASIKFPKVLKNNRTLLVLSNGSRLRYMSAGVRQGKTSGTLGRSSGINLIHASEMCSWENEEGIKSLKSSMSKKYPDRFYLWESTARGYNAWHDMWTEAKGNDLNERTLFLGWWGKDDQRIPTGSPKFERYGLEPPSEEEAKKIRLVKELYDFDIDQEQLAWHREATDPNREREEDDADDQYVLQDQPWTEEDAFQSTGSTFFPADKLTLIESFASKVKYQGYKYYPGTDFTSTECFKAKTWRDVQLKVFEGPKQDAQYVLAADVAFGRDEKNDRSAAQIIACYADRVEQVAEFASASIQPHQYAWIIWSLVGYYGMHGRNRVMTMIEINGPGEEVLRNYLMVPNIVRNGYLRRDAQERGLIDIFNNVRQYIYNRSDSMTAGHSLQFKTNTQLKVAIMEGLRDTVGREIIINSKELVEEMRSITRDGDTIKSEGRKKDDRVFAMAMAVRGWNEHLRRALIANNMTMVADRARRQMNPVDRYNLFTKSQLDSFFRKQARGRIEAAQAARRLQWRGR